MPLFLQNSKFSDFTACSIEGGKKVPNRPFSSPLLTSSVNSLKLSPVDFDLLLKFRRSINDTKCLANKCLLNVHVESNWRRFNLLLAFLNRLCWNSPL